VARTTATNFTGPLQFPYATAATDVFHKEDIQTLAQAVDQHDHTTGKGLGVAAAAGSITNAQLGPDVARANVLANGSFEIWQRGNGPFTDTGAVAYNANKYSADRWATTGIGTDALSVSRDTTNQDAGSAACAAVTFTLGSGGGSSALHQPIIRSDAQSLAGRQVSFSVRVRTSTAGAVRAFLNDGATQTNGTVHTGGGTYQTLTVTATPAPGQLFFVVGVNFLASCTAYIDNACLVGGSQAANYVPLHPADDLARCLRYYEVIGGVASNYPNMFCWMNTNGALFAQNFGFKAIKAVTPTVTKNGTWTANSCTQPTLDSATTHGLRMVSSSTVAGAANCNTCPADATGTITIESNP
jgi:hypothetical protein